MKSIFEKKLTFWPEQTNLKYFHTIHNKNNGNPVLRRTGHKVRNSVIESSQRFLAYIDELVFFMEDSTTSVYSTISSLLQSTVK